MVAESVVLGAMRFSRALCRPRPRDRIDEDDDDVFDVLDDDEDEDDVENHDLDRRRRFDDFVLFFSSWFRERSLLLFYKNIF